jgi:hypothetical protein
MMKTSSVPALSVLGAAAVAMLMTASVQAEETFPGRTPMTADQLASVQGGAELQLSDFTFPDLSALFNSSAAFEAELKKLFPNIANSSAIAVACTNNQCKASVDGIEKSFTLPNLGTP